MRVIYCAISLGFFALISCGGEEKAQEVISMEEFAGEIGEPEIDSTELIDTLPVIPLSPLDLFAGALIDRYDTSLITESHIFDRYDYSFASKLKFKGNYQVAYGKTTKVNPVAEVYYYNFSDTTKTKNAFYNWLDCFGSDCYPLELNEDVKSIKMPPLTTWVYDTTIVVVEYLCEHEENDWQSFEDSLVKYLGKNYTFNIAVDCGGPLKWK